MVINLSLYKIQFENGELYKSSKGGRVQHYKSQEKAEAKIKKLGDIALNAIAIESKARTSTAKAEIPEEIATDTATAPDEIITDAEAAKVTKDKARPEGNAHETKTVKVSKTKKAAKAEKPDEFVTDAEAAKDTIGKTKKAKKNKKTDD